VRAASLHAPDTLAIPTDDVGKNVFKLDRVAPLNGFDHSAAHDALADVQATIFLARLIRERAPHIWSTAMRFSQKAAVTAYVEEERIFCLSEFYFAQGYAWLVTPIGANSENPSEFYVYDLQVNPNSLTTLTDQQLKSRLGRSPKPLRRLRANSCPTMVPIDEAPDCAVAARLTSEELGRRADTLHNNEELKNRLIECFEAIKDEKLPSPFIEMQIYDGFWPRSDEALMERFHSIPWEQRLAIAEMFSDARLRSIALNLIHIERPDLLPENVRAEHDLTRARRLLGHGEEEVPWLTLDEALSEIDTILESCEEHHRALLEEHRTHLFQLHKLTLAIVPSANAK
jgi:exodeoxyribonuclease-1